MTFYLCIGKWGGIGREINGKCFRIIIGWISVAVLFFDIENTLVGIEGILEEQREKERGDV